MRLLCATALATTAVAAAGCGGGGGGGAVPEGGSVAPASAIAFISVNTNFSSDQWQKVTKLAAHFPGTPQLIAQFEKETGLNFSRDVRPALGPEVDLVWVDARNDGNDVVGLTKPDSKAKLEQVLEKSRSKGEPKAVTMQVGDWVAFADSRPTLDKFKAASSGDKLADDKGFKQALEKLDPDSSVRAWIKGDFVQSALDGSLASSGAPPRLTHDLGDLHAVSGEAKAEDNGASVELDGLIDPTPDPATFSPSLPAAFPGSPLVYVSMTRLDAPLRTALRLVAKSVPNFETQLSQAEGVLGLTLQNDVYPLLKGESALAVYPGTPQLPDILFVQKVADENKADSVLRKVGAIAQLSGSVRVGTVQLRGTTVQELTITSAGVTIYDGVAGGKLFVTNAKSLAGQAVSGPRKPLGDDELFRTARDAAGMPDKVAAFAYGDLEHGLPVILRFAQQNGNTIPPEAFANVKPFTGALVYLVKDGDALRISGFQGIK
jgi:hypothetical protein